MAMDIADLCSFEILESWTKSCLQTWSAILLWGSSVSAWTNLRDFLSPRLERPRCAADAAKVLYSP